MTASRLLLAPIALVSLLGAGCGQSQPTLPSSAIAVVGDRPIPRADFDVLMAQARDSYRTRGRAFPAEGTAAYRSLRTLAVRLLVERAQLEQKAPSLGVNVDDGAVAARLEQFKRDAFGGSDRRYRARLREEHMTEADVRSVLRAELLSSAVYQAVTADVSVSARAIAGYYEAHVDSYSTPPSRAVRHLLVPTKEAATRLYKELRAGVPFAGLARRYSRDTHTRALGGRLTLLGGKTAPDLDRVAFSLPTGAVSRPFETRAGWEIVQALGPPTARAMTPLASVRDGIRRTLLDTKRRQEFQRWLAEVRAEFAPRTVYAEGFAPGRGT